MRNHSQAMTVRGSSTHSQRGSDSEIDRERVEISLDLMLTHWKNTKTGKAIRALKRACRHYEAGQSRRARQSAVDAYRAILELAEHCGQD